MLRMFRYLSYQIDNIKLKQDFSLSDQNAEEESGLSILGSRIEI